MGTPYIELGDHLTAVAAAVDNQRSAEHSRLLILAAAARLARTVDFPEFRVPDVCSMCGISRATFYLHFSAKEDVFVELMQHLTELECSLTPRLADCPDMAAAIDRVVDWYMEVHLANASLFTNLTYLQRTNATVAQSWMRRARRLHLALFQELQHFDEFLALDKAEAGFVLEFCGRAMNSVVNQFMVRAPQRSAYLPTEIGAAKRAVSKVFYRALFGADPRPRRRARADASR